ncbi:hypothetical protein [Paludibaculum fermentans]|uniref:hypothetical protein n=1 Tax=Paludibaculum fermentans TaxID=1473598 RepID=UPI003EB757D4
MPSGTLRALPRLLAFLFLALLVCPLRYFSLAHDNVLDTSWVYAMNLAAVHGLRFGVDMIWTTGPLAYLFQPFDMGQNLIHGLAAQALVWLVLLSVLVDLCYFADVSIRNLVAFAACTALAAPLFHFNFVGVENLLLLAILLQAALLLLRPFLWRRFALIVCLTPPIVLIKGTGAAIAVGILGGMLAALALRRDWRRAITAAALATLLLPTLTLLAFRLTTGSWSIGPYLQGLVDVSSEYSILLASDGLWDEKMRAAAVFACLAGIFLMTYLGRQKQWILALPFALPLLVSVKHGFVRQDAHVINFFCMALLLLGLLLLFTESWRFNRNLPILLMLLVVISFQSVQWRLGWSYLEDVSGWSNLRTLAGVLDLPRTRQELAHEQPPRYIRDFPFDPPLLQAIGRHTVTIVSPVLIQAAWYNLEFRPMPVPQGYQCSRKLDEFNAAWLSSQGTEKVLLEWFGVDGRHPLGENPATLLALYQWYEPELLESRHLLLRRRTAARTVKLEPLSAASLELASGVPIPAASRPVFVRAELELTTMGKLAKLLYHVPEVRMAVTPAAAPEADYRVIPESLATPLLISNLPTNLAAAAKLFDGQPAEIPQLTRFTLTGPGLAYYRPSAHVQFLTLKPADD